MSILINISTLSEEIDDKVIYMEDLEKRKKVHGICGVCNEPGTGNIDELIQHSQLNALHNIKCLEWIPFIHFGKFQNVTNVTYIYRGGFGKIYSAEWPEGFISYWNNENQKCLKNENDINNKINKLLKIASDLLDIHNAEKILRGYQYVKAADIYSFEIIMNEFRSEEIPFNNIPHDYTLAVEICKGFRPKISKDIPKISCGFNYEISNGNKSEGIKTYTQAIYASRLLNFKNLPEPINSSDFSSFQFNSGKCLISNFILSLYCLIYNFKNVFDVQISELDLIEINQEGNDLNDES
ncbi:kinase-like domain-containing protein [Rhizophagus irregularis DAOM 181602=DAOM 197198]|uniref:Protein kinase domain-containing protein n=1 Tax=Rhizophagus irregularis (strain DAOM 181602 / DAOM 197198 / MUCL 43194) TaxID=747089 RepID=A0A2P4QZA3_RHIID|nr:hypothetical protein GLOIN_2v1761425 [Rhizophagus irregularis DAOM 181602=DAOM 197198]POG82967.1 hypothetical protein GLOIN_2v1761425 [Rhizophagus irregularis DAOM 181602=DAOM 197198]GBC47089.2 kinase-like domain-containing protein [Rhizophagus irregularis DAOM 181602=DAOM 197198]|eukprot:XP_025189833.1 hypothetical protein GLOIN_2v1761425 [Rhizophagus irregularis DAOM 181602=DAOM 197198]